MKYLCDNITDVPDYTYKHFDRKTKNLHPELKYEEQLLVSKMTFARVSYRTFPVSLTTEMFGLHLPEKNIICALCGI